MAVPNSLVRYGPLLQAGYDTGRYAVAASQVIKAGDFLTLSSGLAAQLVAATATTATATATGSQTAILGIALHDITTGSSVTDADKVMVAIANDKLNVALRFYAASGGNAEVQDASIGGIYGLERYTPASGTADAFYVAAIGETTSTNLIYRERCRDSAVADDFGLGFFGVVQAKRELDQ